MKTRKGRLIESVNLLAEKRYIENKFEEDVIEEKPKFNIMDVGGEGPIKRWKISLFRKKPNGGLKDIMTDDILEKLDLKKTYISRESALEDLEKVDISDLEI